MDLFVDFGAYKLIPYVILNGILNEEEDEDEPKYEEESANEVIEEDSKKL